MSTCQNSTTSEHFQKWPKNQGIVLALSPPICLSNQVHCQFIYTTWIHCSHSVSLFNTSLSFWIAVLTAYFTSSFKPLSVARLCWWLGALSLKYYKYYINTDTSTIKTSMTNTGGDKFKQTTKKKKWLALEVIISFHTLSIWTSIFI